MVIKIYSGFVDEGNQEFSEKTSNLP